MKAIQILIIGHGKLCKSVLHECKNHPLFKLPIIIKRDEDINTDAKVDCVLDLSHASALDKYLNTIVLKKWPLVIGATGHDKPQIEQIQQAAKTIAVLHSQNFSEGIFRLLNSLQQFRHTSHQTHIHETHHKEKKDTPSGTALLLKKALNQDVAITSERKDMEIGTHTITIQMQNESLTFTHKAECRSIFAKGALKGCLFLLNKPKGLYTSAYE